MKQKLLDMSPEARAAYCAEVDSPSQLPKIIKAGFNALQLQYFFTAGEDEVRAWTVKKGSKAPEAAGRIHCDMERGFIMAETMKFEDLKELGSKAECKAKGKYTQNGKNYLVQVWFVLFIYVFLIHLAMSHFVCFRTEISSSSSSTSIPKASKCQFVNKINSFLVLLLYPLKAVLFTRRFALKSRLNHVFDPEQLASNALQLRRKRLNHSDTNIFTQTIHTCLCQHRESNKCAMMVLSFRKERKQRINFSFSKRLGFVTNGTQNTKFWQFMEKHVINSVKCMNNSTSICVLLTHLLQQLRTRLAQQVMGICHQVADINKLCFSDDVVKVNIPRCKRKCTALQARKI